MDQPGWEEELGALRFCVEHRRMDGDGGPTLRICAAAEGRELLRFDCFERSPHYHVEPEGRDAFTPLDPLSDSVGWVMSELRRDLSGWLQKAGFSGSLPAAATILERVEDALRNPPAELEPLDLELLKSRYSEKWETYPREILPAWVAEMDFPLAEPIRRVLQTAVDRYDVGYPIDPQKAGVREAFAERMESRFGWSVDPQRVQVMSDVVQGIYWTLGTFAGPGQGAVVQTPIYPPFLSAVADTGTRLVENRLVDGDAGWEIDFDELRGKASQASVFLLCNPHNPSGRVFARSELEALAELALEHDWVVVTDEIHADLVYPGHEFVPFAKLGPEVAARTITLTSATKAFNIPGLRCAVAHYGSAELRSQVRGTYPPHVAGGQGILGLYATIAAWRHSQPWLDQVLPHLDANRRFLAESLRTRFPKIRMHLPEATYLAFLDCSALELEPSPARFFYEQGSLALTDGKLFGAGFEGFARLNFATSRAILGQVLDRMESALGHARA